jgi:hypothetical protein
MYLGLFASTLQLDQASLAHGMIPGKAWCVNCLYASTLSHSDQNGICDNKEQLRSFMIQNQLAISTPAAALSTRLAAISSTAD